MNPLVVCAIIKYAMNEPLTQVEENVLENWRSLNEANWLWFEIMREQRDLPGADNGRLLREFLAGYSQMEARQREAQADLTEVVGTERGGDGRGKLALARRRRLWRRVGLDLSLAMPLVVMLLVIWFSAPKKAPLGPVHRAHTVTFERAGGLVEDLAGLQPGESMYFDRIRIHKIAEDKVEIGIVDHGGPKDTTEKLPSLMMRTWPGHKLQATMPDSTVLWLNASSELVLSPAKPEGWGRTMNLEGEGYFEVCRRGNATNTFMVLTPAVNIICLGTDFDIRAYASDARTRVSLFRGKLRLEKDSSALLLATGQEVQVDWNELGGLQKRASTPASWKEGYFDLKDASIDEVFAELERWYNVRFVKRSPIHWSKPMRFMASRQEPIDVVVHTLGLASSFEYTIHNDTVYVWQ